MKDTITATEQQLKSMVSLWAVLDGILVKRTKDMTEDEFKNSDEAYSLSYMCNYFFQFFLANEIVTPDYDYNGPDELGEDWIGQEFEPENQTGNDEIVQ